MRNVLLAMLAVTAALVGTPAAGGDAARALRDDTVWLQGQLDAGRSLYLPQLPNGECYATRGLWVTKDDTQIISDGACIVALGHGAVRGKSNDGDPITSSAVFFVSRDNPWVPAPARIRIAGLRIRVPRDVDMYGISINAHQVRVENVEVTGDPKDAVIVNGRMNDGYAARVSITDSRFLAGQRNVISATGAVFLNIERNVISGASDTYETHRGQPWGNPGAGIDLEPDGRGLPILGVRIADNTITNNAGPGILVALSTNWGLPMLGDEIEIVGNRIVGNGTKATPPQHGGVVFNGGQDGGGGDVLLERNVIRDNRSAAIHTRWDVNLTIELRDNEIAGAVRFARHE